jgi:peptidoglycan/xylan/chitin deacetylase (PgdA/CDA1 family)
MKILASWDDGCVHDQKVAELMKKYEIPTIFYWPWDLEKSQNTSRVKKFLTKSQCQDLAKDFEVGSHTVTHSYLTKIKLQAARNEIFNSKQLWEDFLKKPVKSLCYPRGYTSTLIKILVKNAGYENARTTVIGHLNAGSDPFAQPTTLHVGIDRVEYKQVSWEIYARQMLEKARQDENSLFHFFGHSWEIDMFNDWDNLENFLKDLKGK